MGISINELRNLHQHVTTNHPVHTTALKHLETVLPSLLVANSATFFIDMSCLLEISESDLLLNVRTPSGSAVPTLTVSSPLVTATSSGSTVYTITPTSVGVLSATYTVTLGKDTSTAKIEIVVPATATYDDYKNEEAGDNEYALDILTNDIGGDTGAKPVVIRAPAHGSVRFDEKSRKFIYTPNDPSKTQPDSFTYSSRAESKKVATVELAFKAPAVTIPSASFSVDEDTLLAPKAALADSVTGFKDNLHKITLVDSAGAHLDKLTLTGGEIELTDARGHFTFTPDKDFNGSVPAFSYTVILNAASPFGGTTLPGTIDIAVNAVEDRPEIATFPVITVTVGTIVNLDKVLAGFEDGDKDAITILSCTQPTSSVGTIAGHELTTSAIGNGDFDCILQDAKGNRAPASTKFTIEVVAPSSTLNKFTDNNGLSKIIDLLFYTYNMKQINDAATDLAKSCASPELKALSELVKQVSELNPATMANSKPGTKLGVNYNALFTGLPKPLYDHPFKTQDRDCAKVQSFTGVKFGKDEYKNVATELYTKAKDLVNNVDPTFTIQDAKDEFCDKVINKVNPAVLGTDLTSAYEAICSGTLSLATVDTWAA